MGGQTYKFIFLVLFLKVSCLIFWVQKKLCSSRIGKKNIVLSLFFNFQSDLMNTDT